MLLTKRIVAPTVSGSCSKTAEVIKWWRKKKATDRIRERDCKENTDQHDGTGWLRNSIHGNVRRTHHTCATASRLEANMFKVTHLLSHLLSKSYMSTHDWRKLSVKRLLWSSSHLWFSLSFLCFLFSSLPHTFPHSRPNQSAVTNPSFFTM